MFQILMVASAEPLTSACPLHASASTPESWPVTELTCFRVSRAHMCNLPFADPEYRLDAVEQMESTGLVWPRIVCSHWQEPRLQTTRGLSDQRSRRRACQCIPQRRRSVSIRSLGQSGLVLTRSNVLASHVCVIECMCAFEISEPFGYCRNPQLLLHV